MRVYLDNCCYNRPFDPQTDLRIFCILSREVGSVDAERFIAHVNRERMDYTKWRQTLFQGQSIEKLAADARATASRIRRQRANALSATR